MSQEPLYKNKDFLAVMILMAGFVIGGFAGIGIASLNFKSASIGGISSSQSVPVGAWFRYDLSNPAAVSLANSCNWSNDGANSGLPYVIVRCENKTTWTQLNDATAGQSADIAYGWNITTYWPNNLTAYDLLNGTTTNDNYKFMIKVFTDAWNNRATHNSVALYNQLRPQIDTNVLGWKSASAITWFSLNLLSFPSIYPGAVAIGVAPVGYGNLEGQGMLSDLGAAGALANKDYGYTVAYDPQSGMLSYYSLTEFNIGTSQWNNGDQASLYITHTQFLYLSGYGGFNGTVGTPTQKPAAPSLSIEKAAGKPFGYNLVVSGVFATAFISMSSNDTPQSLKIKGMTLSNGNSVDSFRSVIPIPLTNVNPVTVTVSAYGVVSAFLQSDTTVLIATLNGAFAGTHAKTIAPVTATREGNSINVSWNGNSTYFQYRVLVNGSQVDNGVTGLSEVIHPVSYGTLNITVVGDSRSYNQSSLPSATLLVSFHPLGAKANLTSPVIGVPADYSSTAQAANTQYTLVWVLAIAVIVIVAVLAWFFFIRGKFAVGKAMPTSRKPAPRKTDARRGVAKYRHDI